MEGFIATEFNIGRLYLSKNVQVILYSIFILFLAGGCAEETAQLHHSEDQLVEYLTDLMIKESAVEYYELSIRDSIASKLEQLIIDLHQLDSTKLAKDISIISEDTKLSGHYFDLVRANLNMQLDSIK